MRVGLFLYVGHETFITCVGLMPYWLQTVKVRTFFTSKMADNNFSAVRLSSKK